MVKISIRRKVLLILLSGALAVLLAVGGIFTAGQHKIQQEMDEHNIAMKKILAESLGGFTEKLMKERLKDVTTAKAQHLDRELYSIQEDVEYMAETMHVILTSPDKRLPRVLPDTRLEEDIMTGTAYIHYSTAMLQQGMDSSLQTEIGLAGNLADVLKVMSTAYIGSRTSLYAGSKHGYLLCVDLAKKNNGKISIFPSADIKADFLANYDPRERDWYKQGQAAGKTVFSNVFIGAEGNLDLTCASPYYDENGFAGVVGISYTVEDIYQLLVENAMEQTGHSFVLDEEGKVIFSSEKEALLAATVQGQDIRQVEGSSMAEAAKSMMAGETGVMSVEMDGENYFLAYAPLKITGWSLGILLDTDEVMAPVEKVENDVVYKLNYFEEKWQAIMSDIMWQTSLILLPVLLMLLYASNMLAGRFTRPIRRLAEGAREIAEGNFERKVALETGDELEEEFSTARIKESLNALPDGQPVADILNQMLTVVRQFAGGAKQSDDITMLGLRYRGK